MMEKNAMNTGIEVKVTNKGKLSKHCIEVGQYSERMYFIDRPAGISSYDKIKIDDLLMCNHGVGIIVGSFDENLSICMISRLACKLLGYKDADEILTEVGIGFKDMTITDNDYIRKKLENPDYEIWGCSLKGKDGNRVSVRVGNVVRTTEDGGKLWYLSVRYLDVIQYDTLTGEYNRYGFIHNIKNLKKTGANLKDYAIAFINIRGFKAINDLYGSEFGDRFIIKSFNHFKNCELQATLCARNEADKFLMLVKRKNLDLDKLANILKIPYNYGDKTHLANSSCGIYFIEDDEIEINTMIDCAKIAKEHITDTFVSPFAFFEPFMMSDYLAKTSALFNFYEALENDEFKVYYQPVVDCNTSKVVSAEALIRWETPDGIISPATFIPALEENGCISKLDEYVLKNVVEYQQRRLNLGLPLVSISINVSRMDFFDIETTQCVYDFLEHNEIARKYTHFEITETSYHSLKELQAEFIKKVRSLGGKVYIDDFGVANSSIDMLLQYDFEILKLDMQFVRDMVQNQKVRTLIEATIHMAHKLGIKVIAEGVESNEQLYILHSFGCDYIQGYYFSKPLCEEDFTEYLKANG